jgi:PAS domain S-box-containing protein
MNNRMGMAYRCKAVPNRPMELVDEGSLDLTGYSPKELTSGVEISFGDLVHPEDRDLIWDEIQAALQEKRSYRLTYRITTAAEQIIWVSDQGRGIYSPGGETMALEGSITDITDRVMAQQILEQRVEERTREIMTILEISQNVAITLELKPLMFQILEQLKSVVEFDGAAILFLDGDVLKLLAYQGPILQEKALKIQFALETAGANREVIQKRRPVIIPDVLGNTPLARSFRKTAGEGNSSIFDYVRSWMGVPLILHDKAIGMVCLDHKEPNHYGPPQSKLVMAFASQVAVAIENARLYASVLKRADEAQTLLAVQKAITSRLEPNVVLQMIADEARRLTSTEQGSVYLLDGEELIISVVSGDLDPQMVGYRLPVAGSVAGIAIHTGKPLLISDVVKDQHQYGDIIKKLGARSFIVAPLMGSTGPIGTITVANKNRGSLGPEEEWVITMLASGAEVALENARLYREEQEQGLQAERRRRVAEGLRDILAVLNSDRSLQHICDYIIFQAGQHLGSNAGVIYRLDEENEQFTIDAHFGMPAEFTDISNLPLVETEPTQPLLDGKPYAESDLRIRMAQYPYHSVKLPSKLRAWADVISRHFRSNLSAPLVVKDEMYGTISLYYKDPRDFGSEDIGLAVSFADQAALAIENARLRSQAAASAVATERNRLARDLHDAVTQTLFSASLIAEVLPRIWERNPDEAVRRVQELRELTRGALAEMRTLLLELRPSALIEAEPSELFKHLIDAFTGRARLPVQFSINGKGDLHPDVKVALYRIAQEALNNISKHSEATQVKFNFDCCPQSAELWIEDNGQGFAVNQGLPEHLGLGIMRERAESINAELSIISEHGKGTVISVLWTDKEIK